jgi:hypothetical protein
VKIDLTSSEPCFGSVETLGCAPAASSDSPPSNVPVDVCLRSKDGRSLTDVVGELAAQLLDSGDYAECSEREAADLRGYRSCTNQR